MLKFFFILSLLAVPLARSAEQAPKELLGAGLEPVLGTQVPLDLPFVNEKGETKPLSAFLDGRRPVALVLSYYGCSMLCGLVLNGARESLQKLDWKPGDHYQIVTISIDPKEDSDQAADKKKTLLTTAGLDSFRSAAATNWHFLVGKEGSERRVADAVGFRYKWVEEEKQWAHGAALFVLSPTGKLSRVLYGINFPPKDLKLALLEAGEGKVGTFAEKLMLFCYHYDPKGNKYAILATRLMSLGGAVTVIAVLLAYLALFLRYRRKGNACTVSH